MGLFKRLFGKAPKINFGAAKIDEQIYLLNYRDHYADILHEHITSHRLAELFLFRAWTAQFGYRIFSSNSEASETLIGEAVNASNYLGLGVFQEVHGFSVETELGSDFISLIEDRWRGYDLVVSTLWPKIGFHRVPAIGIVDVLTK